MDRSLKTKILIAILSIIILLLINYIIYDKFKEKNRQDIFQVVTVSGSIDWNTFVIETVNSQNKIPYILNNSVKYLPIEQLYERLN